MDWRAVVGVLGGLGCVVTGGCADDAPTVAAGTGGSSSSGGSETRGDDASPDSTGEESGAMSADGTTMALDDTVGLDSSSSSGEANSTDDGPLPECVVDDDCDDAEPCTTDVCNLGTCSRSANETATCRPAIDVQSPARAETILGPSGGLVPVSGIVTTGYGDITGLTLNGADVNVEADGSFATMVDPITGGNLLDFVVTDSNGWQRRRVQSFLWGTSYREPTTPMTGATEQGIAIHLDQETLDDDDRSPPIDDVASVVQLVVDDIDLSTFVDPGTPITSNAGYDVYLTSMTAQSRSTSLDAIDTGVHATVRLEDLSGDLVFDCTIVACQLAGGDGTGDVAIEAIELEADLVITVTPSHQLDVDVQNLSTTVIGLDITSDNPWTNFLITVIEPFILGGVVADLEDQLEGTVNAIVGPLIADGLSQLDIGTTVDFPNLVDPLDPITVELATDVGASDFHDGVAPPNPSPPQSGLITFRGGGYAEAVVTPYDNLGVPERNGCDAGGPPVAVPQQALVEIGLTDDMLNQLMFAGWQGGLLEFPLPLDDVAIDGAKDVVIDVSGMLAPTATDCNAAANLRAYLGDLRIDASMTVEGMPVDFVAFSSMSLVVQIDATDAGIAISIPAIDWIETELTVSQDEWIEVETGIADLLEETLSEQLLAALSGGLSGIALPEIDLSAAAGLPPGSAVLSVTVDGVAHEPGVTVISGHL